ncbi:aromatic amino acid transaminase [Paracoccaceae bacterium GXU_MW_L88]
MFNGLPEPKADKILQLMQDFANDPRDEKIDLGVGVYRNAEGVTPIMKAVSAAEARIHEIETTKKYGALAGVAEFLEGMKKLVFGATDRRMAAVQGVGGTGALHQAFLLYRKVRPEGTVWISEPGWPNHPAILDHLGMARKSYRYADGAVANFEGMLEDLQGVQEGDLVLLHGCCHNPSGIDPDKALWKEIAALMKEKGATVLVDLAYLGFGEGLEADAWATRMLAEELPELMVAASCSKNFGLYRERVGALFVIPSEADAVPNVQATLNSLNRVTYSFPPDHGARIVGTILGDEAMTKEWADELEAVRIEMQGKRDALADALAKKAKTDRFAFLKSQNGMFSRLGATEAQVKTMCENNGIYMTGDSRINIAGMPLDKADQFADAILEAGL